MEIFDIFTITGIIGFVIALFFVSNNEIKRSLEKSRKAEQILESERASLMESLKSRTDELEKSENARMNELAHMAEFGRISQGLFHDLMTPLSSIVLHTEKLKKIPATEIESTQKTLEKAIQASQRMGTYIQNIRTTMSRQSAERDCMIDQEITDIVELFGYKIRAANAMVTIDSDQQHPWFGDSMQLKQVFLNLVSNALDAFETLDDMRERKITIVIREKSEKLLIKIEDTAGGISDENLQRIFEAFFTTKPSNKGTGIGLTTAKSIVEKNLSGTLSVESEPGKGTAFTVTLPMSTN